MKMPISEKIRQKIVALDESDEMKHLMLAILTEEDKGNHRFKDTYERLVNEYLSAKDGDSLDQNQ